MTTFNNVYMVKRTVSKEQFMREVLIKLTFSQGRSDPSKRWEAKKDTPDDILDATFGEVKESVKEVLYCDSHIEMDYTASVGYNYEEKYWEKVGDRRVEKTRTVTDWKPFSGHTAGDADGAAFNDEAERSARQILRDGDYIASVLSEVDDKDIEESADCGESTVAYKALKAAKRVCEFKISIGISLPGDTYKDEHTRAVHDVKEVSCYKIPYYEVEFTYKGKSYRVEGFACGKPNAVCEIIPLNDLSAEQMANKEMKSYKKYTKFCWIGTGVLIVIAAICSGNGINAGWTWIFPPLSLAAGIALAIFTKKQINKRLDALKNDSFSVKLQKLKAVLAKKGYGDITEQEAKDFLHNELIKIDY